MEKQLGLCKYASSGGAGVAVNAQGKARYIGVRSCRNSFCVLCSAQKTTRIAERVVDVVTKELLSGGKAYFGTLTMSKETTFNGSYQTLSKSWTEFNRQLKQHIERKSSGLCSYGGIRGFDVTFKEYTETPFHLHIHFVVVFENDYFSFDWIKQEIATRWCRILEKYGSKGSVGAQDLQEVGSKEVDARIRYILDVAKLNKGVENTIKKDIRGAGFELSGAYKDKSIWGRTYVEMLDHIEKTEDPQSVRVLQEFYNGIKGKRQMSTFGRWKHLEKELDKIESEQHEHEEEAEDEDLMPDEVEMLKYERIVHNILMRYAPEYPLELVESAFKGERLEEYKDFDVLTKSIPYKQEYSKDDWLFIRDELLDFITKNTGEVFYTSFQ